jgi:hypothetical protein
MFRVVAFALAGSCTALNGQSGAELPWIRYEAEAAQTSGRILGPSREYLTPASEATGRQYVRIDGTGQSIRFEIDTPANALVLRYSIPDSAEGGGLDSSLSLYINASFQKKLHLTSKHAWVYGDFPWSNDPSLGRGHKFFDEINTLIPLVASGDQIELRKEADDDAAFYLVDFVELEMVPAPLEAPEGSLSLTDFGAIPNDGIDDSAALLRALEEAEAKDQVLWIPTGDFQLDGERISIGEVTLQGAGMWHSRFTGKRPMFEGTGKTFSISDIGIFGQTNYRDDTAPDNAFNGNLGKGSRFINLWIEHLKCAFWTNNGSSNLLVSGCRIRNVMADGLNFCDGTRYSTVENSHFRNTGDDALASWSPTGDWSSKQACLHNTFRDNTIELPWHANGIAVYGGGGHLIEGNHIIGTVMSGAGILISSGFEAVPFSSVIIARNNQIISTGGECYIGERVGGIWIHAKDSDIEVPIIIEDNLIRDSTESGVTLHGPRALSDLQIRDLRID